MHSAVTRSLHTILVAAALHVASGAAHAQCTSPDSFEPNDSCTGAALVAPGLHTGLTVQGLGSGALDPDFFRIDVPAGQELTVEVFHTWADGEDLSLYLYDATVTQCGDGFTTLAEGFTFGDNEAAAWTNATGATVTTIIEVSAWDQGAIPVTCDDYDLRVTLGPAACSLGVDDGFEPNDSCASAVPLATGLYHDLVASTGSADFYRVPVAHGDRLTADLLYGDDAQGSLIVELYDGPACTSRVALGTGGGSATISWANATGSTADTTLVVRPAVGSTCNEYSLSLTTAADPCLQVADDNLEPNDTCASAAAINAGSLTGLFVSSFAPDHYRVTIAPGDRLAADVHYAAAGASLAAELYSDAACTLMVDSMGGTGDERVEYANATGAPLDVFLLVRVDTTSPTNCTTYDLDVAFLPDLCLSMSDDALEPNDDCAGATLLAPGSYTALYVHEADPDYYVTDVAPGHRLTIDLFYTPNNGTLQVGVFEDASCFEYVDFGSGSGFDRVRYTNTGTTTERIAYQVQIPAWLDEDCNSYAMDVLTAPDPCLNTPDDSFEPNDACGAPAPVTTGLHTGLFVGGIDPDYYSVQVAPGERLTVDTFYPTTANDALTLRLYEDPACTMLLDVASWTGADQVSAVNATGAPVTWTVVVTADDGVAASCRTYDMSVALTPDPCFSTPDDVFEDNDDCASATPLTAGTQTGLFASFADPDYYGFVMAPGGTVQLDMSMTGGAGDLDMFLFEVGGNCASLTEVASDSGAGAFHSILYTNTSGSTMTYVLQVTPWWTDDCNTYDLTTTLTGHLPGTPTCFGDGTYDAGSGPVACPCGNDAPAGSGVGCRSSLGKGARLEAAGSAIVANDDLRFLVRGARPHQPSMLVQGGSLIAQPFKDGILCVGNPTERLEIVPLDATGDGTSTVSIVQEGAIPGPGATRWYQQWFRDPGGVSPCGSGSNFTNAIAVTWN